MVGVASERGPDPRDVVARLPVQDQQQANDDECVEGPRGKRHRDRKERRQALADRPQLEAARPHDEPDARGGRRQVPEDGRTRAVESVLRGEALHRALGAAWLDGLGEHEHRDGVVRIGAVGRRLHAMGLAVVDVAIPRDPREHQGHEEQGDERGDLPHEVARILRLTARVGGGRVGRGGVGRGDLARR